MKYAFILGHNPALSAAEVLAALPTAKEVEQTNNFLIVENDNVDCKKLLTKLGGTIKIGEVISDKVEPGIISDILVQEPKKGKLNFGVSFYDTSETNIGMDVKTTLKGLGYSTRLVTGQKKALTSVIIEKNKVIDFLNLGGKYLAKTCAIQDFESYGQRDFGRPVRDMRSGSMPPKLAQIMLNLSQTTADQIILDPFCGSGTMLQEALLLGYRKVIGTDKSEKAVADTNTNLEWILANSKGKIAKNELRLEVKQVDVLQLSTQVEQADAVVTEPYLGPPLRGRETELQLKTIISDLEELYLGAFTEFAKVISAQGKVVMIFPSWRIGKRIYNLQIEEKIEQLGFVREDDGKLIYSRPDQKVYRNVRIFKKT